MNKNASSLRLALTGNRRHAWLLAALLCAGGAVSLTAATATFEIADGLDDGYYAQNGENYTNEYAICGKVDGYNAPYLAAALRFANVTIPQGTVISSAYLRVQAYWKGTGPTDLDIRGENYDSADPLDAGEWLYARNFTTASAAWNITSSWVEDQYYNSPELKTIIQAIVNRAGWASGNALALHLRNTAASTGYQLVMTKEGAAVWDGSAAQLIVTYAGGTPPAGVKSENYIPGTFDATPSLPLYLNNPDMYYPAAIGGLCWASANAAVFAYWDRNAYNGVKYWNLVDNGTAPLREPALPVVPGHEQADVKSVVAWLAHQYYGLNRTDEAAILTEFANVSNGLSFAVSYLGPVSDTSGKTTLLNTIKGEINAGRPFSVGSWGTYFGGAHQVPVMGYKEMSNTVDSTIYIHRNVGGTQSEYVNFFASSWGNLDMDKIVPGGTPVDHYEAMGDNTAATAVTIDPDHVYNFRQTHNFSFAGDMDWIRLNAVSGSKYTIATRNLGTSCDTVLQLYASNGTTLLAQDDDGGTEAGASKIIWNCYASATVYIRVHEKSSRSGHATNYDLQASYVIGTDPQYFTITTVANPAASGATGGGGVKENGSSCTVTATANSGYTFANWTEGATVVSASASYTFTVTGNRTLTANFSANQYTVTFDAQGGTVDPASKAVTYGASYGALPTPTFTGYDFGGWWTGASGAGTQVTSATIVVTAANHTLFADWVYVMRPADEWYAAHGFEPGPTKQWLDLDNYVLPDKGTTLWQEYVADTDPNDLASVFRLTGIDPGPPVSVGFEPSSTQRVYRLQYTDDLSAGVWHDVGAAARPGEGEGDAMSDSQNPAGRRFYRVQVDLPQ